AVRAGGGADQGRRARPGGVRAGGGDALARAAGEGRSVLADGGVVAVGQFADEAVGLGGAGGGGDLFVGGVGPAVRDVVADGVGEEEGVLEDQPDRGAQGRGGQFPHVVAADEDGTPGDVVEARQDRKSTRL